MTSEPPYNVMCSNIDCLHSEILQEKPTYPRKCPICGTEFVGDVTTVVHFNVVVPKKRMMMWSLKE